MTDRPDRTKVLHKALRLNMAEERYFSLRARGILFLDAEIDEESFANFCRDLVYLGSGNSIFEGLDLQEGKKPLWVVLNSPGGDVLYGFGIHDCIRMLVSNGLEVNILGIGIVASMATIVMQAGTKRFALSHTQFLIHQVSETILFKTEEVSESEERVEELKRINKIALGIIADRAGIDIEELLRLSRKKDYWLDPEGAKSFGKYGLIDEIISTFPF